MMSRILGALLIAALAMGCASTRIASLRNPEVPLREYQRIMVAFPLADLELRRLAEDELVARSPSPERFVASYEVFFPGREYGDAEFMTALENAGVDAILWISLSDAGTASTYVPQTTRNVPCPAPQPGVIDLRSCGSQTTGGYSVTKPWARYEAALLDLETVQIAWYATASTGGNALAGNRQLLRSMAQSTMSQLKKDQVVRP